MIFFLIINRRNLLEWKLATKIFHKIKIHIRNELTLDNHNINKRQKPFSARDQAIDHLDQAQTSSVMRGHQEGFSNT